MILPTKHISLSNSYLGAGMTILKALEKPMTPPQLWKAVSEEPNIANARRFYRTLDLLYILGAIDYSKSKIRRTT